MFFLSVVKEIEKKCTFCMIIFYCWECELPFDVKCGLSFVSLCTLASKGKKKSEKMIQDDKLSSLDKLP